MNPIIIIGGIALLGLLAGMMGGDAEEPGNGPPPGNGNGPPPGNGNGPPTGGAPAFSVVGHMEISAD